MTIGPILSGVESIINKVFARRNTNSVFHQLAESTKEVSTNLEKFNKIVDTNKDIAKALNEINKNLIKITEAIEYVVETNKKTSDKIADAIKDKKS